MASFLAPDELDLVHRAVDDEHTPSDGARLQVLLESNPEARQFYLDLMASTRLLAEAERVPSPSDLRQRVLAALPADRYATRAAAQREAPLSSFLAMLRAPFEARPAFVFAYAFSLGLLAGIGGYVVFRGDHAPAGDVAGTLADTRAAEAWPVLGAAAPAAEGLSGTFTVRGRGERLLVVVDLQSTAPVEVVVSSAQADWHVAGVVQPVPVAGATSTVTTRAVVLAAAGAVHFHVLIHRPRGGTGELQWAVRRDGQRIADGGVAVGPDAP